MHDEPSTAPGTSDDDLVRDIRRAFGRPRRDSSPTEERKAAAKSLAPSTCPPADPAGLRIGDFRIVREVGRGGMGVVYLAEQVSLGRHVALKVLRPHPILRPEEVERFRREASAVARLRHPNIVSVHAVGEEDDVHYLAMDFIDGASLADLIERMRIAGHDAASGILASIGSPTSEGSVHADSGEARDEGGAAFHGARSGVATAATLGLRVAEALVHAHGSGVIHRDVKPSNILLDRAGRPFLSDFGLAREEGAAELSRTGELIGTPAYMSPEQASGARHRIDHRTDVYSLGATLYELLALEAPFRGDSVQDVIRCVLTRDPISLRKVNPRVPRDLETIVHVALEKDPARRYASAEAMASDLRSFLDLRPIRARPVGPATRVLRHARRRPAVATALVLGFLVIVVGPILFGLQERLAREAIEAERDSKAEALARYWATQAEGALRGAAYQEAAELSAKSLMEKPTPNARGALFRALSERPAVPEWTARLESEVLAVAVSPDGSRAVASVNGRLAFLGLDDGAEIGRTIVHTDRISCVAFSPDGRLVALGSRDEKVRLEPLVGDAPRWLVQSEGNILALSFTPDGSKVAFSGSSNTTIRFLDVETGKPLPTMTPFGLQRQRVFSIAFSSDGRRVASASMDKTVCVFDITPGAPPTRVWCAEHGEDVTSVAFEPSSNRVASGSIDGTVRLWDAEKGEEKRRLDAGTPAVKTIAFSPSGSLLAWGGDNRALYVWDAKAEKLLARLDGHEASITSIAFSPDARRILSASLDGTVRSWALRASAYGGKLEGHKSRVLVVAFRPRGHGNGPRVLASGGGDDTFLGDNSVRLWDLDARRELTRYAPIQHEAHAVVFHPDGKLIAVGYSKGGVRLWDSGSVDGNESLPQPSQPPVEKSDLCVDALAFSADGTWLAVGGKAGTVNVWNTRTKNLAFHREQEPSLARRESGERIRTVEFSPSGTLLAAGGDMGEVFLFESPSWKERGRFAVGSPIASLAIDPGGQRLATGCGDGAVTLWEIPSGRERRRLDVGPAGIVCVAFVKGGAWLAAASSDGRLRVWDAATLEEVAAADGLSRLVRCFRFSPEGAYFAFGAEDNSVGFRDFRLLEEVVSTPASALLERVKREMRFPPSPHEKRPVQGSDRR